MRVHNQKGMAHLVIFVLLILGAVMVFASYYVATHNKGPKAVRSQSSSEVASTTSGFTSSNDLQQASNQLDSDADDPSLDPAQLDTDLNSLL